MYLPENFFFTSFRRFIAINLFVAILFCVCSFYPLHGQTSNENYPVQFNQYMFCYSSVNPSAMGTNGNTEIAAGYQRPVTGFTGLAVYYFNVSFAPFGARSGKRSGSVTGARFYNENEGAYINRMRFYLMYSFHTRLSNSLNFSGGLDLGAMNFAIKATPTTEGASVLKPDANAGIWVYNDRFHAGISVNQIFNSVFRPLDERTILPIYFNISASMEILRNEVLTVRPHVLISYPYYSGKSINVALSGLWFERIISLVSWKYNANLSAMLGINDITLSKTYMDLILSYTVSTRKAALPINSLEISMLFSF